MLKSGLFTLHQTILIGQICIALLPNTLNKTKMVKDILLKIIVL